MIPSLLRSPGLRYLPVILWSSESNSGPQGGSSPTTLSANEQLTRTNTFIVNNNTYTVQPLKVTSTANGGNGLTAHFGMTDNVHYGHELLIANDVDAGIIRGPVLIVKDGQGGSRIGTRVVPGAYKTATLAKIATVLAYCSANGYTPVLYSDQTQGINDADVGSGTPVPIETFKEQMRTYRALWTSAIPNVRVWAYTELPVSIPIGLADIAPYNTALGVLASEIPYGYYMPSSTWAMFDVYHWNDAGLASWYAQFRTIIKANGLQ